MGIKLDLTGFQHISSDDKKTTLRNKRSGHQVTLAHNALAPEHRAIFEALAKVPKKEEPQKMAQGGVSGVSPCLNPSCKSHGKPHPNCRCYGMAEGGKVDNYCSKDQAHKSDCEYFAGGGTAGQSDRYLIQPGEIAEPTDFIPARGIQDKTTPEQDMQRDQQRSQQDATFRAQNQAPAEEEEQGYQDYAKGGKTRKMYAQGTDDQGADSGDSSPDYDPKTETALHRDFYNNVMPWVKKQMSKDLVHPNNGEVPAPTQPQQPPEYQDQPPSAIAAPQDDVQPDQSQDQPAVAQDTSNGQAPNTQAPPQVGPQDDSQTAFSQPVTKATPQQPIPKISPQATPQDISQAATDNRMDEARAWSEDLSNGHIEPETYKSLFDKKDTLGKIGTLFGLMVSGAGSGLTHQPNMLMEMMNKQISNDLDAQEKSATNRQNYIKLAQQHELNKANILTQATGRKLTDAHTAQMKQTIRQNAEIYGQRSALQDLLVNGNKMPEGPEKQRYLQSVSQLYQNMDQSQNTAISMLEAGKAVAMLANQGTQDPGQVSANDNLRRQQEAAALQEKGMPGLTAWRTSHSLPGVQGTSTREITRQDQDDVTNYNTLNDQLKNLIEATDQYSNLRGNVDPKIKGVIAAKAHEAAALYNKTIDHLGMTEGRAGWLDKQVSEQPQNYLERLKGSKEKLQELIRGANMRKNKLLAGAGFPNQEGNMTSPGGASNMAAAQKWLADPKNAKDKRYNTIKALAGKQ